MDKNEKFVEKSAILSEYTKKKGLVINDILNWHRYDEPLPDLIDDIPDEMGLSKIVDEISNKKVDEAV